MTLSFIIEEERKRANNNPTEFAMPEFLDTIHPCLYHLFVVDWRKICPKRIPSKFRGNGILFLRDVMADWLDVCNKSNYYCDGMLTNFDSIQRIKTVIGQLTNSDMQYIGEDGQPSVDYVQMECRMYEIQQQYVDQKAIEDQEAKQQRELEEKARRKHEEAERKAAKQAREAEKNKPAVAAAPTIDQLLMEAQQLLDQSPLPRVMLQLYVRPTDAAEPYTAELVWDNTDRKKGESKRPSDIFTGQSFPIVISKAKTHVSELIDQLIEQQQKNQQRQAIKQQINDQNATFQQQMEESRRMLQQMQDMIAEQQRQHEESVNQLRAQMANI